jgi:hypothetical protein
MKKGDKWNWAMTITGILLLFLTTNVYILNHIGAEKYRGAFVMILLSFYAALLCLLPIGILSAIRRNWEPMLGWLLGVTLFCGICGIFGVLFVAFAFLSHALKLTENTARPTFLAFSYFVFIIFPVLSLVWAFLHQPTTRSIQP